MKNLAEDLILIFSNKKISGKYQNVKRTDIWLCADQSEILTAVQRKFAAPVMDLCDVNNEEHEMPHYFYP